MMISALKMTADRIAESGEDRPHDVELVQARVDRREQRRDDREVLRDVVGDGERRQRAPGDEELLADLDDLDELGRVGVEVDHVPGLLGGRGAGVHGHADVRLGERRGVVGAVAGHRDELAAGLLPLDEGHLVLGGGLGEEVVDARLLGDRLGGQRVVARDHDGLDAHAAQFVEPLPHALLDDVLEVDDAQHAGALGRPRRRRAAACRPPAEIRSASVVGVVGDLPPRSRTQATTEPAAPLRTLRAVDVHARHPGLGGEGDPLGAGQLALVALAQAVLLLGQDDDGAALGRLVGQRRQLGGVREFGLRGRRSPGRTRRPGGCRG